MKEKEEEQKKNIQRELSNIDIKDGDYQVQVHIIEARDLKGENENGTSDPVVFVECFGQKRHTAYFKDVTSCVFDQQFIFDIKGLDKHSFEEGLIRISCYDSNSVSNNELIGRFAMDAPLIYRMNTGHELYRQWVPLMDDEDSKDLGVQGYLKVSISIIGPGDKAKVHNEDDERAEEIAREMAAGSDVGSLIKNLPTIRKEWKFLVVKIYRAEGLPIMDGKLAYIKAHTDALCQLTFAGGKPLSTKVVTTRGETREEMTPEFNCELWYPVALPTTTQLVKIHVWDKEAIGKDLIGNISEKICNIMQANCQVLPLQWYNMYGAQAFKPGNLLGAANIVNTTSKFTKSALRLATGKIDWEAAYNNSPDKAPAYKGRLLLEFSIQNNNNEEEIKPFRIDNIEPVRSSLVPPTEEYMLQALVFFGNDLPVTNPFPLVQTKYRIRIAIGIHEMSTKEAYVDRGMCQWNQFLVCDKIFLPIDVTQIPDIFIYLDRDEVPICFTRLKVWKKFHLKSQPKVMILKAMELSHLINF